MRVGERKRERETQTGQGTESQRQKRYEVVLIKLESWRTEGEKRASD